MRALEQPIRFNEGLSFRNQTSGYYDVRTIATVEAAHVMFLGHNPNWSDGISQANSCKWGSTACRVYNDQNVPEYTASCTNCGQRWSRLSGDNAVLSHIYGRTAPGTCCTPLIDPDDLDHVAHAADDLEGEDPDSGDTGPELMEPIGIVLLPGSE